MYSDEIRAENAEPLQSGERAHAECFQAFANLVARFMQMGIDWTRKFMQPTWLFIFSALTNVFLGFVFSLLIAVFLKKEDTPFNSNIG